MEFHLILYNKNFKPPYSYSYSYSNCHSYSIYFIFYLGSFLQLSTALIFFYMINLDYEDFEQLVWDCCKKVQVYCDVVADKLAVLRNKAVNYSLSCEFDGEMANS